MTVSLNSKACCNASYKFTLRESISKTAKYCVIYTLLISAINALATKHILKGSTALGAKIGCVAILSMYVSIISCHRILKKSDPRFMSFVSFSVPIITCLAIARFKKNKMAFQSGLLCIPIGVAVAVATRIIAKEKPSEN